ncbi:glutamate formimidoyltransferase [Candidatus Acetothermia bacterium]|nr:glutamate formimidoyltransferase [Candidatus Acetothermia bacterium]MBI3659953.1 glutamate formimidoyltransferase [Candidatus Acetothermia bacterium]
MNRLIECVPNISEGRDAKKIEQIVSAIKQTPNAVLLDVDSDHDHNRTVITFVGDDLSVEKAILALTEKAIALIDLNHHQGEHPRMGAVDVIPFIPIKGATMENCIALAQRVGKQIWEKFRFPVYLYEEAATRPERKDLSNIRKGEFEHFAQKILESDWAPDFGERKIHPTAGVVAVGARMPLIAFNVNLGTDNLEIAKKIAKAVRHSDGGFRFVKALGFALEERGIVQVSMNMTNYKKTPLFRVFEMVKREAERYGVSVIGSEIVGLAPQEALDQVADFYLQLEDFQSEQILENRLEHAQTKS